MSERHVESEAAGSSSGESPTVIDAEAETVKPAESESASPPPPRRRDVAPSLAIALLLVVLLTLIGAVGTSPFWAPALAPLLPWAPPAAAPSAAPDVAGLSAKIAALENRVARLDQGQARVGTLEQRLSGLESRVAALTAEPSPGPQVAQQGQVLGQISDRLALLEQRVGDLSSTSTGASAAEAMKPLQAETQSLQQKLAEQGQLLARLQAAQAAAPDRTDAALLISLGQLRAAAAASRPFKPELESAEALARARPQILAELRKLDASAAQGLTSQAVLAESFQRAALAATRAGGANASSDGWGAALMRKVEGLVSVRRVGERAASEGGNDALLAEAESALKSGDLAGAVAAMKRLDAPARAAAQPWIDEASARLAAEATLAALETSLTHHFLADSPAGAKP